MNLAPLKYRRILSAYGGPVRAMECGATTVMGNRMFQANAYLADGLRPVSRANVVFGNPDGTGTALRPSVARHKAISEALERWAHHAVQPTGEAARYGFDVDPSSNGMAAFPGFLPRQARRLALGEAAERFALIGWWSGVLDARPAGAVWPGVNAYRIENPMSSHEIVLLHALADEGVHAYGHGSGADFQGACVRAAVELVRAQYVLRRYARRARTGEAPRARSLFEQRCLYFSSAEGHAQFQERLGRDRWRAALPRVAFDGEIPGPWSEYACVWRVAVEPPADFLDSKQPFFFW